MGTERTGPDLTNVGTRQPSLEWNLVHLYNPRIVVKESVMPAYSWMFTMKEEPGKNDVVVNVPEAFLKGRTGKVVATPQALHLVAYLQSLKQVPLPDGRPAPEFLYKRAEKKSTAGEEDAQGLDGAALYATNCQSCHQANGEGLQGAFPSLKDSKIVLDDSPETMVDIIMNGYSGREKEGFPPMPAVGTDNKLSAEEIAAIMNHEKTSWGNNAKQVTPEQIQKIMDAVRQKAE
jgi:cytochrome c oxidase cbb3-type subunit 2